MKHRLLKFIFVINFLFLACVTLADTDSWTSGTAWLVYSSFACLAAYVLVGWWGSRWGIDPGFKPDLTADDIAYITTVRDEKDHVAAVKALRERYPRLTLFNANDMVKSL